MKRHRSPRAGLRVARQTIRQLADLPLSGGMAYVSFPTDEMGECEDCSTMW